MNAVTGAFGYTGKYIARHLLRLGEPVITLTGHPDRPNEFATSVRAFPFRFDDPNAMAESLAGVRVLYNTYWIRFDRGTKTHEMAVANTRALIRAAEIAGVERMIHISITNPDSASPLPYFRGKALLEEEIRKARFSYAIVRPTVLFSVEDILINNIAFLLRKLPLFIIPGGGQYRLQPICVEDLAKIAVEAAHSSHNIVIDAVGPEIFSFEELVRLLAKAVRSRAIVLHASPGLALAATRVLGAVFRDVVLTRDELDGLMADSLISRSAPTGSTCLSRWLVDNAGILGTRYASELDRHYSRDSGAHACAGFSQAVTQRPS
ncbi:MAG TPA: NAD(P)H-binding protein [Bryobacteraceae bacterium]|nr:NAD(P)H-binding protein [Candidatus Acidoferrales bacterium]HVN04077.1 NAD(P)H-binding protein [Bryobacteraceae bacterium]